MMEENDIDEGNSDNGGGVWNDGDLADHLGEIRPFVEYTLGQHDDLPGYNPDELIGWGNISGERENLSIRDIRESKEPWAHKLAWGVGFGVDEILPGVASGEESAQTVLPGIEYFTDELLGDEYEIKTVNTGAKEPDTATDNMRHDAGLMAYSQGEGPLNFKHIEPTLGGRLPDAFNHAIGNPEDSIYADPDRENAAWPLHYEKALRLTHDDEINTDTRIPSMSLLSGPIRTTLRSFVDARGMGGEDDFQDGEDPIHADNIQELRSTFGQLAPTYATPEFGRSIQENFGNYDRDVEEKFEYLGRGIETFYREFGFGTPMAIGGSVDEPELYRLSIDDMQQVMNEAPNDLSQYT